MILPIHAIIQEMQHITKIVHEPRIAVIHSDWLTALHSLLDLRDALEDLPPITAGQWFLDIHIANNRVTVTECLRKSKAAMRKLGHAHEQHGYPGGLKELIGEFIILSDRAEDDLSVLQMPYALHHRLQFQPPAPGPPNVD